MVEFRQEVDKHVRSRRRVEPGDDGAGEIVFGRDIKPRSKCVCLDWLSTGLAGEDDCFGTQVAREPDP